MDKAERFTLELCQSEAEKFKDACERLHVTRSSVLRAFVRQFVRLGAADFGVVPVRELTLGAFVNQEKG